MSMRGGSSEEVSRGACVDAVFRLGNNVDRSPPKTKKESNPLMNTLKLLQQLETDRACFSATIDRCDARLAAIEMKIERQRTAPALSNIDRSLAAALQRERQSAYARLRDTETRIAQVRKCVEQNALVARLDLIGC
jgi:hypothetical protein